MLESFNQIESKEPRCLNLIPKKLKSKHLGSLIIDGKEG
jgi:hypothetical protein